MVKNLFGFIGLGNMGEAMARNAVLKGCELIVHDIAGTTERAPKGSVIAQSNHEVARRAKVVALSLPNLETNRSVILEIAEAGQADTIVVDTCTVGIEAAQENTKILKQAGIIYLDAPVSGLKFRAEEGTLVSMVSGHPQAVERARTLIEGYSRLLFHVGGEAGQGQRMKVLNNAICIASYVITAEALSYGEAGGLKVEEMLQVLNESSGQNFGTKYLFPKYVATQRYDESGAEAHIVEKDIGLFVKGSQVDQTPNKVISLAHSLIKEFSLSNPSQDQMRIYPFIKNLETN